MPYADSDYERSWKMQTKGVTLYPATMQRLIEAAPALLVALRDAYDALDYAQAQVDSDTDRMHLTRCRRKIKPVIDWAEGRGE